MGITFVLPPRKKSPEQLIFEKGVEAGKKKFNFMWFIIGALVGCIGYGVYVYLVFWLGSKVGLG